jgi:hypothetical protein
MAGLAGNVRYWVESGSRVLGPRGRLLTHTGHLHSADLVDKTALSGLILSILRATIRLVILGRKQ